jgi:hypothetical protein
MSGFILFEFKKEENQNVKVKRSFGNTCINRMQEMLT